MYGLPAAAIAIWHSAKKENRAKVGGIHDFCCIDLILTGRFNALTYYVIFRVLIKVLDLKTPGREERCNGKLNQAIMKKKIVIALGGNALLQRGEVLSAENQQRSIQTFTKIAAQLARDYQSRYCSCTLMTRVEVNLQDDAFNKPGKYNWPCLTTRKINQNPPPTRQLELALYGWQMKKDGQYIRRVVPVTNARQHC
ncbi:unnamed protein product [Ranitomeya imitator]|uniref:Carbamate kinase n=1 Tax=Ranitomeya imitator TaxID=111125 RepID=A0ABN9MKC5_9NEOB|nr:unnamed protein product [Ranitomeya imitator]